MLPSPFRLSKISFKTLLEKGCAVHSSSFTLRYRQVPHSTKFAVVVSKKVAKTAVERNTLRRRIYPVLRTILPLVREEGVECALFLKTPASSLRGPFLASAIKEIFRTARLIA